MSAVIYGLPRSFCLESWAAALFMEESCKSAPGTGSNSALEDEDGGVGGGGGARCSEYGVVLNGHLTPTCWSGMYLPLAVILSVYLHFRGDTLCLPLVTLVQ